MPAVLAAAVAVAALGLHGCGEGSLGYSENSTIQRDEALPDGIRSLRIHVPLGSITVAAGPAGRLSIDGIVRRAADTPEGLERLLALPWQPRLTAVLERPGVWDFSIPELPAGVEPPGHVLILRARLEVPPQLRLELETGRGNLAVVDRRADVRMRTASGDLKIERVRGNVHAFTGLGVCAIIDHRGSLDVTSGSGQILAYVRELGEAGVRLVTEDPSITVHLPDGQGFALDAQVARCERSKDLVNSFGVANAPWGESGLQARGTVAGGGPPVYLRVTRGHISVPKYARTR